MTGHVLEMLSEFVDGALSEEDRRAVENHLSACGSCRAELEDLKGSIASLGSLPKRPLPPGFMARLQAGREKAERRDYVFLPFPARVAAFAMSSFIVGFIVFESYRGKPSQMISDAAAPAPEPARPPLAPQRAQARLDDEAGAKKDSFGWSSAGDGGRGDRERPRSLAAARGSAPGRPMERDAAPPAPEPAYTNEELNAHLERQKKEMGIRRIVGNAEKRAERAAELATPQGFVAAMGLAEGKSQAVLLGGATPDLKGAAAKPLKMKTAVAPFGGAVGRDIQELREAWREAEMPGAPPRVDFEKHTAVIPPGIMVDVRESQGVVIVRYRPGPPQYALIESTRLPIAFELKR